MSASDLLNRPVQSWTDLAVTEVAGAFLIDEKLCDRWRQLWAILESDAVDVVTPQTHYIMGRMDAAITARMDETVVIAETVNLLRMMLTTPVNSGWLAAIAAFGLSIVENRVSLLDLMGGLQRTKAYVVGIILDVVSEHDEAGQLIEAASRLFEIEYAVMVSEVRAIETQRNEEYRRAAARNFQEDIRSGVAAMEAVNKEVYSRVDRIETAARKIGIRGAEVARAAEQAASAMRDAAGTSSLMADIVNRVSADVSSAASIADTAADGAMATAGQSESLEEQADAIGSIVQSIRAIAGKTNLLALNATIEAARAGEVGRGFTIVAQEMKSLAGQTAAAASDVAAKIGMMQEATAQALDANRSVHDGIRKLQEHVRRIEREIRNQTEPTTTVVAAVEETALSAASMSEAVASIQQDLDLIGEEISGLAGDCRAGGQLQTKLGNSADAYLNNILG